MKLNKIIVSGLALFMSFGSQIAVQPVIAAELEIKMQLGSPDGTPRNEMDRRFAAELETILGGRAEVVFFAPNSVTSVENWLQATGSGLLDIGFVSHSIPHLEGSFPQMELFRLPGLARNQTITTAVYWRIREQYPKMDGMFIDDDNVVEIATFITAGSHLHSKQPICQLSDLKGKVIAISDPAGAAVLENLGASPSFMDGPNAYLALQNSTVDGVLATWGWVNDFKINEVTEYHTLLNMNPGTYSTVMNKDTYNLLTDVEKLRLKSLVPMYYFYNAIDNASAATKDIPAENILSFSEADRAELTAKMQLIWAAWVRKAQSSGVRGQEILDETVRLIKLYDQN